MERVYVGVDWADDHHDVYVTDDTACMLDRFTIPHSYEGMEELEKRLANLSAVRENILLAVESHEGLLIWNLLEKGYHVYLINPKAMSRYRDRYRMSSSKSDPQDAMVLANVLRTDLHLYKPVPKGSMGDARLKQITRAHKNLSRERVRLVNQLVIQLKSYYPAILLIFSNLDHEIALTFLQQYPSPEEAEAASIEDLRHFFRMQRYCRPNRVPLIHELLHKPSLRAPLDLAEIHKSILLSLVPVIRCLTIQIENIEKKMASIFKENPSHEIFSSLPAGPIIAARLNGEIGSDGSRFPTRECLQTEAGTAPVTRRSGKTIAVGFRWQCNKHLRDALQGLARESVKRCPWAREYFANQMRLGHKPSRAYRALANRWAAIIWKMIQERSCFNQARLENNLIPATLVPSH
jgi:transposase